MKKASDALTPTGARLSEVLDSRSGTTARVLARAARLQALSAELQKLDAPWAPALRVANLRGDCVVVFADNAAAAARARLESRRITEWLQRRGVDCRRVEIRVRPAARRQTNSARAGD